VSAPGRWHRPDGFTVDPDELGARAGAIDGLTDRLNRAASGPLLVNRGTFGVVGGDFGTIATQATALYSTTVGHLGRLTAMVADDLRSCSDAYATTESDAARWFTRLEP
jgi:Excreted virulence factor EspC, type VII ESX diderm